MISAPALRLQILALDGGVLSSLAGPLDALAIAQRVLQIKEPGSQIRMQGQAVCARQQQQLRTSSGLTLSGFDSNDAGAADVLLIPGFMLDGGTSMGMQLEAMQPEIALIQSAHRRGVRIAASCSGTFLLAYSGLLDGRRATTSWWLGAQFRKRFPKVELHDDQMLVDEGDVITTGGASAILDLVLRLIEQSAGASLAHATAKLLNIGQQRQSQAPYVSQAMLEKPRHSLAEKIERYLQQHLAETLTVSALASHCDTSERSLLRHFRAHYQQSPLEHIQALRVERAKALMETTHLSVEEIIERCGYADVSSFRKLFKRETTLTPGEYRERFRLRAR